MDSAGPPAQPMGMEVHGISNIDVDSDGSGTATIAASNSGLFTAPESCEMRVRFQYIWESMTWMALQFSVNNPHYYSYEFTSSGEGEAAKFTARAIGDLDCDGTFSTFEISAKAENGEVPPFDIDKVKLTNPDE